MVQPDYKNEQHPLLCRKIDFLFVVLPVGFQFNRCSPVSLTYLPRIAYRCRHLVALDLSTDTKPLGLYPLSQQRTPHG